MSSSWQLIAKTPEGRHVFTVYIPRNPGVAEGPLTKEQANDVLNPPREGQKWRGSVGGPLQYSLKAPQA